MKKESIKQSELKENLTHWYTYFDIGEHTVTVSGSYLTGSESVYIDDVLVSKKTNWTFKSTHRITLDEKPFDVFIELIALFKPNIRVQILKDDIVLDEDYLCDKSGRTANLTMSIIVAVGVAFLSGLVSYFLVKALGNVFGSLLAGG